MKTPTWGDIEAFCRKDGWQEVRETDRRFFQKVLADGTVLEIHSSFSSAKTMSPGRFKAILRDQLRVTEDQFWDVLKTGTPARLPAPVAIAPAELPAYVVGVLKNNLHKTEEQIARLSPAEARKLVEDYWSRENSR